MLFVLGFMNLCLVLLNPMTLYVFEAEFFFFFNVLPPLGLACLYFLYKFSFSALKM